MMPAAADASTANNVQYQNSDRVARPEKVA